MEPKGLIPDPPPQADTEFPRSVFTMRHPYTSDAIGMPFWHPPKKTRQPLILPIRPDNHVGRIGQQSSCFTLHMHESKPTFNPTLAQIKIPASHKSSLREELRRLNINQFSVYNDFDHLSKDIKQTWGV